jgi:hypothetical protein
VDKEETVTPQEMELRIKLLEDAMLTMLYTMRAPLSICSNPSIDDYCHPHWVPNPAVDWVKDIIHLPTKE